MSDVTAKIAAALAAAFLAFGGAGGAAAATVTAPGRSTNSIGDQPHIFAKGYGANTPAGAAWAQDPAVIPPPGILQGADKSPFFFTPKGATQDFFSVGKRVSQGGLDQPKATLTFKTPQSAINILWGTIDLYNTITFFSGAFETFSLDGAALGGHLGISLLPSSNSFDHVALLKFDRIEFISNGVAPEFGMAPVPVPAAGLLLPSALGGIVVPRRRKAA